MIKPFLRTEERKLLKLVYSPVKVGFWKTEMENRPFFRVIKMSRKDKVLFCSISWVKEMLGCWLLKESREGFM